MDLVALSAINDRMIDLVGGKAAGLGALIKAGENVPARYVEVNLSFRRRRDVSQGSSALRWPDPEGFPRLCGRGRGRPHSGRRAPLASYIKIGCRGCR
jgi:hypothetical protein